jgi:hypothetical protein
MINTLTELRELLEESHSVWCNDRVNKALKSSFDVI